MPTDENGYWARRIVGIRQRTPEDIPTEDARTGLSRPGPKGQPAANWPERYRGVVGNTNDRDGD